MSGCSDFIEALKFGFLSGSSFLMRMMEEVSVSEGSPSPSGVPSVSLRSYILHVRRRLEEHVLLEM